MYFEQSANEVIYLLNTVVALYFLENCWKTCYIFLICIGGHDS